MTTETCPRCNTEFEVDGWVGNCPECNNEVSYGLTYECGFDVNWSSWDDEDD